MKKEIYDMNKNLEVKEALYKLEEMLLKMEFEMDDKNNE